MPPAMPLLPPEILYHVISFVDWNTLLTWRRTTRKIRSTIAPAVRRLAAAKFGEEVDRRMVDAFWLTGVFLSWYMDLPVLPLDRREVAELRGFRMPAVATRYAVTALVGLCPETVHCLPEVATWPGVRRALQREQVVSWLAKLNDTKLGDLLDDEALYHTLIRVEGTAQHEYELSVLMRGTYEMRVAVCMAHWSVSWLPILARCVKLHRLAELPTM